MRGPGPLGGRDFKALSDFTREEIEMIVVTAFEFELERAGGVRHHFLHGTTICMRTTRPRTTCASRRP